MTWTRDRRAREETSLPSWGGHVLSFTGKAYRTTGASAIQDTFRGRWGSKSLPGARRSPSSARRKAPPFGCYANFVVRIRRVRGSFRWVRVTYGATRGRRSRRKRNVVDSRMFGGSCGRNSSSRAIPHDAARSHDEAFLELGVPFATDCFVIPNLQFLFSGGGRGINDWERNGSLHVRKITGKAYGRLRWKESHAWYGSHPRAVGSKS
ncbi:hypothetical protein TNCT_285641 [Trichonephila clavata]|uniref:Uncharacterized protein n=1 Tax=Trichonephila clavata TaxID=2740835 RepID=A0A8X6GPV0_TRICU|nr:hypothetical protein TNCT_285641 [Trichonephila clavata]